MPNQHDIEHLLRRTEYVARPHRVAELLAKPSMGAVVDDILSVPGNPGSVAFTEAENWRRGEEMIHFWLDRMAFDSPRPVQEKMGFFWHGHFCSELNKVHFVHLMKEQIDTFRTSGLGNLRSLAKTISTQVAMLRYLDNNQNKHTSPNQNFARELMELFLLGVGNYTEADVEAGAAAWTGHTDDWGTGNYVWRGDWHDGEPKQFLGRTINSGGDPRNHGYETIDVILGNGVVPAGAARNAGRPTREVAAEFISSKLWIEFAGTEPPGTVIAAMRKAAIDGNFAIAPWLKTMFLRPEFYSADVKQGLVRSPVALMVAMLVATGLRSKPSAPIWRMEGMGQRPLYPPDVSGWKHNDVFVNAGAMGRRASTAKDLAYRTMMGYWEGDGLIHLAYGTVSRAEIEGYYADKPEELVARFLQLMGVMVGPTTLEALYEHARRSMFWERTDAISLIFTSPEFNVM